jgi:hypothetical protein
MTQDKVNAFIDKTIGSLCRDSVDIDIIIKKLRENSAKYYKTLMYEESSKTKKNYLAWYIIFADKRVEDLKVANKIGLKIGKSQPDQIFKLVQLKEKLTHKTEEKFVQFD